MNPIERIEAALKERYNVRDLPEHLALAVEDAKNGSLEALESVLDGRELYRWANDVQSAFTEAREALTAVVEAPFDLASLTVEKLRALADERGVDVPAGPKAAIVEALNAPSEPEPEPEAPEAPDVSSDEAAPNDAEAPKEE